MELTSVLGTAIGLVTVYLVLALSITAANEGMAAFLSSRGRWLRKGVLSLLSPAGAPGGLTDWARSLRSDPKGQPDELVDLAYASPFIAHLGKGPLGHGFTPSSIPGWTLLQGTLDAAATRAAGADAVRGQVFDTLASIESAARQLPEGSPLRTAVLNLAAQCNGSVTLFRQRFEAWFSEFETQLVAWYRQKTQWVVMALSVALVAVANVDTVSIVRQLSADPKVRAEVVRQGLEMAKASNASELLDTGARDRARSAYESARENEAAVLRSAASGTAASAPPSRPASAPLSSASAAQLTQDAMNQWTAEARKVEQQALERLRTLDTSGLRFGWADGEWAALWAQGWLAGLLKVLGLALSATAISLGAPFWFDVLKNLTAARQASISLSAGTPKKAG